MGEVGDVCHMPVDDQWVSELKDELDLDEPCVSRGRSGFRTPLGPGRNASETVSLKEERRLSPDEIAPVPSSFLLRKR